MQNSTALNEVSYDIQDALRPALQSRMDVHKLAKKLQYSVEKALDGPQGACPADVIAALAALAGYCARWQTHVAIANNEIENDFIVPLGTNRSNIQTSKQVEARVCALTGRSFASTLISAMMIGSIDWLPHIDKNVDHNFIAPSKPRLPEYSVEKNIQPQTPPQALLLMLWDSHIQKINEYDNALELAVTAYAVAVGNVIMAHAEQLPPAQSAQMALETAISMSRLSYAF